MEIKERIEKILFSLKKQGIDRRTIEREMDYKQNYIDQVISKGGNEKFLKRLEKYHISKSNIEKEIGPTHIAKRVYAGDEIVKLKNEVLMLHAQMTVLMATVASRISQMRDKEFSVILGEIQQAMQMEYERIYKEYLKEQQL